MRPSLFTLVSLVFAGFLARVIPHPFNFTPIVAMALVAGVYAKPKWLGLLLPLGAMWVSDLLLNNTIYASYYEGFQLFGNWSVYLALGLVAVLPVLAKAVKGSSVTKLLGLGVGGSVLFFLVSNIGVWAASGMYPLNAAGLLACLGAGLPFFPNTLLSTLLFGAASVWAMESVSQRESSAATTYA